jgi:hypothetical protein
LVLGISTLEFINLHKTFNALVREYNFNQPTHNPSLYWLIYHGFYNNDNDDDDDDDDRYIHTYTILTQGRIRNKWMEKIT